MFNRIICFHSFSDKYFPVSRFIKLVKLLKLIGVKIISLSEIVEKPPRGFNIAITLDDGYKDNFEQLQPLLIKHKVPATIFVGVDLIGKTLTEKENSILKLKPEPLGELKDYNEWLRNGFELGIHTLTHKDYSELTTNQIEDDFFDSTSKFETLFGFKAKHFAYPFGHLPKNKDHFNQLATKCNIQYAYTVNWGNIKTSPNSLYINRVCIGDHDSILISLVKTIGLLDKYYQIRHKNEQNRY